MKTYKEFKGMSFSEETPIQVMEILQAANEYNWRIRVWYGDTKTGRSWNEENDIIGNVGKSNGLHKIPLLIKNKRSSGGDGILDDCIIKIVDIRTNEVLYQNVNFNQSLFKAEEKSDVLGYSAKVRCDSMVYANCKSIEQAERLAAFMNGKRHSK
jgi:hypothetical protein